jgi:hypothetical protein
MRELLLSSLSSYRGEHVKIPSYTIFLKTGPTHVCGSQISYISVPANVLGARFFKITFRNDARGEHEKSVKK